MLAHSSSNDGMIDIAGRRIVIKLLVTYFQRNHSKEVCRSFICIVSNAGTVKKKFMYMLYMSSDMPSCMSLYSGSSHLYTS